MHRLLWCRLVSTLAGAPSKGGTKSWPHQHHTKKPTWHDHFAPLDQDWRELSWKKNNNLIKVGEFISDLKWKWFFKHHFVRFLVVGKRKHLIIKYTEITYILKKYPGKVFFFTSSDGETTYLKVSKFYVVILTINVIRYM